MNPTIKRYILSSATTFLAVFFTTVGAQLTLSGGQMELNYAFFVSLFMIAVRAGVKGMMEALVGVNADK